MPGPARLARSLRRLLARVPATGLALAYVAASTGCMPVSSVVGRSAAVLPKGEVRDGVGGGGFYVGCEQWEKDGLGGWELREHETGAGVFHMTWAKGLGGRADVQLGGSLPLTIVFYGEPDEDDDWMPEEENVGDAFALPVPLGFQFFGVLRWQLVGGPVDPGYWSGEARGFPVDLSVEAGAGAGAVQADCHVGVNLSVRTGRGAIPYVSYRFHRGAAWRDDVGGSFEMNAVFAGVEREKYAVELFYGWPAYSAPERDWSAWESGGASIVVKKGF